MCESAGLRDISGTRCLVRFLSFYFCVFIFDVLCVYFCFSFLLYVLYAFNTFSSPKIRGKLENLGLPRRVEALLWRLDYYHVRPAAYDTFVSREKGLQEIFADSNESRPQDRICPRH